MKRVFIIQDLNNKLYWYGHYSNKNWTDLITEVVWFDSKHEAVNYIENIETFDGGIFTVIPIYSRI